MTQKIALVTGGSGGIGAACVRALAHGGYKVAVHYRSGEDAANALCQELDHCKSFQADLSAEGEAESLLKKVREEFGGLDILVNNAGRTADQVLTFAKPTDFDELIATNLKPVFLLSKFGSKMMIRQKFGRIINISSVVGYTGNPGQSIYAATKGAITAFTKSIAFDLGGFGITANCVAPGFIETPMTDVLDDQVKKAMLDRIPLRRFGKPEDIAAAVVFLASEQAGYITGSTLHVNGGLFTN